MKYCRYILVASESMKLTVFCSNKLQIILSELLKSKQIQIDDRAPYCIVEAGYPPPSGKVSIVFDEESLRPLIDLLDRLAGPAESYAEGIIGEANDRYTILNYHHICFFEARGNSIYGITGNGEYRVKEKLFELEAKLPQNRFIRINKSVIINISQVKEIIPWFGRRLLLRFDRVNMEMEVSKNYVRNFKEFLGI